MTLGEMMAATRDLSISRGRRRSVVREMQRMQSIQRERDLIDLGWRDPDAGWEGADVRPELPVIGYRDLGGEG